MKSKKTLLITGGIFLFMWFTNPSIKAFKDNQGTASYGNLRRNLNLLVCSVYSRSGEKYLGVLENFVDITYHPKISVVHGQESENKQKQSVKEDWSKYEVKQ
jgi:hypothetical protein